MRKRLRKKLRRNEFAQLGFSVRYRLTPSGSATDPDDFLDRFVLEAVEASGLHCGGGGGPVEWDFFVCPDGRRSATETDRTRVEQWLAAQPEVSGSRVGPLLDAWSDTAGEEQAR